MATIHTFNGNEIIATEVPKYLNDNFSALNTETANLSKSVVKTINSKSPVNGNINITGFDSYWEANEQISVGDIRIPKGRENSGYIFECTKAGTTGSTQPEIITEPNEVANYAEVGRVGQVRVIFNLAEKEVDEVLATGVTYSRLTYPELWDYAQSRPALIITEAEWQAKYAETNGKFVPYYSLGDGSTTFRTPLLGAYLKGAENSADVGKYVEAGLPNITGVVGSIGHGTNDFPDSGALSHLTDGGSGGYSSAGGTYKILLDASNSNSIYGNSDTVTPETMNGVWVIKAVGVVVDSGETDIAQVLQGVEQVQSNLTATNNKINGITDYIVESYNSGTEWYEVYKSGKVRQGGKWNGSVGFPTNSANSITITFSKPFSNTDYYINGVANDGVGTIFAFYKYGATTTSCKMETTGYYTTRTVTKFYWVAEGQGV